jgi:hypothetical protein
MQVRILRWFSFSVGLHQGWLGRTSCDDSRVIGSCWVTEREVVSCRENAIM